MQQTDERRKERRLRYQWPIWFAEDFNHMLTQGQMLDISSRGAAFTCYADQNCPYPGQSLTARFSVPKFETDESFGMASFIRSARVCRVDDVNGYLRKVALQFYEPLPMRPGEQAETEVGVQERLKAVTI